MFCDCGDGVTLDSKCFCDNHPGPSLELYDEINAGFRKDAEALFEKIFLLLFVKIDELMSSEKKTEFEKQKNNINVYFETILRKISELIQINNVFVKLLQNVLLKDVTEIATEANESPIRLFLDLDNERRIAFHNEK